MKYLILFEDYEDYTDEDYVDGESYTKELYDECLYQIITRFKSEDDLENYFYNDSDTDKFEKINWKQGIKHLINDLKIYEIFPNESKTIIFEVFDDILDTINLDDRKWIQYRGNPGAWKLKDEIDKYNI